MAATDATTTTSVSISASKLAAHHELCDYFKCLFTLVIADLAETNDWVDYRRKCRELQRDTSTNRLSEDQIAHVIGHIPAAVDPASDVRQRGLKDISEIYRCIRGVVEVLREEYGQYPTHSVELGEDEEQVWGKIKEILSKTRGYASRFGCG